MLIILYIILALLAIYVVGMFVVLRLITPFMGFRRYVPPTDIPKEYREAITRLESQSADAREYLQHAYDFVLSRWRSERFKTVTLFPKIFRTDLKQIWNEPGYLHCNTMNFVLFAMLANSKFFRAEDVEVHHTILNYVLHQYLRVRVGDEWVEADPAGSSIRGLPLGQRTGLY